MRGSACPFRHLKLVLQEDLKLVASDGPRTESDCPVTRVGGAAVEDTTQGRLATGVAILGMSVCIRSTYTASTYYILHTIVLLL